LAGLCAYRGSGKEENGGRRSAQGKEAGNEAALMAAEPGPQDHRDPVDTGHEEAGNGSSGLAIGKWLRFQMLAAIVFAVVALPKGVTSAYSAFYGGMAAYLPAVFFAAYAGRKINANSLEFLRAAVVGETVKLALTVVICLVVFRWVDPLAPGWFFVGMIGVIMAGWVGLYRAMSE
jgi:F0F1-type ATP synthase assembly protein I